MKKALIAGITGQDGSWLARLLIEKGYKVYGSYRRTAQPQTLRLDALEITDKVTLVPLELLEESNIIRIIKGIKPDEIYHLAAQSFVGISFEQPLYTAQITALGTLRLLEAMRNYCPEARFYQASSSEQYGNVEEIPQSELTPFKPDSPYAVSKVFAHDMATNYRRAYNMFICCGILFNHESELRGHDFVTRKITYWASMIKLGKEKELRLGNLDAKRDWGYAKEYVEVMWRMLQQDKPDDYVVATGKSHSVKEFLTETFGYLELDIDKHVVIDDKLKRPQDVMNLCGDAAKAKKVLGWEPKTDLKQLIKIMVDADLECVKNGRKFVVLNT